MDRPPDLRRSLLFVAGADSAAQAEALGARPDVLAQDLEDFTPPSLKDAARRLAAELFTKARAEGCLAAVRVNPLDSGGLDDLAAVVPARPVLVLLPKAEGGEQIAVLARELGTHPAKAAVGAGRGFGDAHRF
ncbi:aldolase/citrate lyase family protein [Dankookia sp. GCM10030260]|uniref:aldolase/citrate lyase family protein n=1 Tax=Dankookia sp. GCM10030260 TaxID=3273390 RepID=UPI00360E825C